MMPVRKLLSMIVVLSLVAHAAHAQRRPGFSRDRLPIADSQKFMEGFFENFFGAETAEDRGRIKQVKISFQEESQAGAQARTSFLRQLKQKGVSTLDRGDDVAYLRKLVEELRPMMTNASRYRRIDLTVADAEDTDAISFPGGSIVVFRGLIDFCESEAALVAILGHELSHIDRGHQLHHLRRWKVAQQQMSDGFNPQKMMPVGGMMAKMFMQPFRLEEETEADEDGARWAFQLGYDSSEMARVFLRLEERDGGKQAFMPSFLRSHPFHQDRYLAILKQTDRMSKQDPSHVAYIGRQNLRQRTPRTDKAFPDKD